MNRTIGIYLIVYSLLLAGLSFVAYHLAPAFGRPTLIAGMAGGALCFIWGVRALAGSGGKALPILTLIPVTFALLPQAVSAWARTGGEMHGRWIVALMTTLLLSLSLAMLIRIAWSGVVFDAPPQPKAKDSGRR